MPASSDLPRITTLTSVYADGVTGASRTANTRRGGKYDQLGGVAAVAWSRQAQRDRDLFRAITIDGAEGDSLTERVSLLFGQTRREDAYGAGSVTMVRATAAGGAGTFYAGTRIQAVDPTGLYPPQAFAVATDTPVNALATSVLVPVRTADKGASNGLQASATSLRFDDPVWDVAWAPRSLSCTSGTARERDEELVARARKARVDARPGLEAKLIEVCIAAGAVNVAAFESFRSGDASDSGLNVVYVGDAAFNGNLALTLACEQALERVRVLGCDLEVLPMARVELTLTASVTLWTNPADFDLKTLDRILRGAVLRLFTGATNPYIYSLDAIRAEMVGLTSAVQDVAFSSPTTEPSLSPLAWPATLSRFVADDTRIAFTFVGP